MRSAYWAVFGFGVLAVAAGLGLVSSPLVPDVPRQSLDDWYAGLALEAAIAGILAGAVFAYWARAGVRYTPDRRMADFPRKIARLGFWSMAAAAVLAVLWGMLAAYLNAGVPLSNAERVGSLAFSLKFFMVAPGASIAAAAFIYAVGVTYVGAWGGSYAVVAPEFVPTGKRR